MSDRVRLAPIWVSRQLRDRIAAYFFGGRLWQAEVEPWRLLARIWRNRGDAGEPQYVVGADGLTVEETVS